MRDVDPAPIEQRLEAWSQGHAEAAARQHALERWRERLIDEPDALDALAAAYPALDRRRAASADRRRRATSAFAARRRTPTASFSGS